MENSRDNELQDFLVYVIKTVEKMQEEARHYSFYELISRLEGVKAEAGRRLKELVWKAYKQEMGL